MATDQVSKRYAQAWLSAAKENSALAALGSDCMALQNAISASPEFVEFLKSPLIKKAEQQGVIDALCKKGKFNALTHQFLNVLVQNHRLKALPSILVATAQKMAEEAGEVQALVTSATPLDAANISEIATTLSRRLGKDVKVESAVNPDIIGGLVIRVGSTLIDDSVKTKLERLQRVLQASAAA